MASTIFTESYEQFEVTFDESWAEYRETYPGDTPVEDDHLFDLTARDGSSNAFLSLTRVQAEAVLAAVTKALDDHDAWQAAAGERAAKRAEEAATEQAPIEGVTTGE